MAPRIVVCGATGQQGSAVATELMRRGGVQVEAFSRRPTSPAARSLAARGVTVRRADLLDAASLVAAFEGADAVFGVTQPWTADYARADVEAELAQGRNVVDACRRAGVGHLVLSTAMRVDDAPTGVPHVDSKKHLERYLEGAGVPFTLVRPGTFMDNIGQPFFPVKKGTVRGFVAGDVRLPFVSCRDIGKAVAEILAHPAAWQGKAINLMADSVSGLELCATLGRVRRERFTYEAPPAVLMRVLAPEFFRMRQGFEKAGRPPYPYRVAFDAALKETRRVVGDPWCLERFFEASGYVARVF